MANPYLTWSAVCMALAFLAGSAFAADPATAPEGWHRPQYHFAAARDWLNDPNGLVFFEGEYHLFFQRCPGLLEAKAGTLTWGHAVSTDLMNWTQLPDALKPDETGDIWSGSIVVDWKNTSGFGVNGKPPLIALYTGAKDPFAQRLAYSNDRGRTWTKFAGNPVLPNVNGHNRDPKVIWHEPTHKWVMALYLDKPHAFALYASPDLKQWTQIQTLTLERDDECPDFFPLNLDGDAANPFWVFTAANGRYRIGTFDGKKFAPATDALASEHGPNFYAAQTYSDIPAADGRRIQIGWMRRDGRYPGMPFNQQMSIPSVLTLRTTPAGPRLFRWPVEEIEKLRRTKYKFQDTSIGDKNVLDQIEGELFDITAEIDFSTAKTVTFDIHGLPITLTTEDAKGGVVLNCWDRRVALASPIGKTKLRVVVDRTTVEIFADDGGTVVSGCHLPPEEQRTSLGLSADGGTAKITALTIYELRPAAANE